MFGIKVKIQRITVLFIPIVNPLKSDYIVYRIYREKRTIVFWIVRRKRGNIWKNKIPLSLHKHCVCSMLELSASTTLNIKLWCNRGVTGKNNMQNTENMKLFLMFLLLKFYIFRIFSRFITSGNEWGSRGRWFDSSHSDQKWWFLYRHLFFAKFT